MSAPHNFNRCQLHTISTDVSSPRFQLMSAFLVPIASQLLLLPIEVYIPVLQYLLHTDFYILTAVCYLLFLTSYWSGCLLSIALCLWAVVYHHSQCSLPLRYRLFPSVPYLFAVVCYPLLCLLADVCLCLFLTPMLQSASVCSLPLCCRLLVSVPYPYAAVC